MNTILAVLDAVVNSLWQALAVTALVCLALKFLPRGRVSNNAATRHAIWWATLAVVLVLPASPRLIQMMRPHPQPVAGKVVTTPRVAAAPAVAEPVIVTVAPARTAIWPAAVFAIWAAILLWRVASPCIGARIARTWPCIAACKRCGLRVLPPFKEYASASIPARPSLVISAPISAWISR